MNQNEHMGWMLMAEKADEIMRNASLLRNEIGRGEINASICAITDYLENIKTKWEELDRWTYEVAEMSPPERKLDANVISNHVVRLKAELLKLEQLTHNAEGQPIQAS